MNKFCLFVISQLFRCRHVKALFVICIILGAQSLLAMWTKRVENVNSQRHVEFYGRLASDGNKAKLYPNIEDDSNATQISSTQIGERQR